MTETIQQLKEDIAVLQEKLNKLEEAEKEPNMMLMRQGKVDIIDYNTKVYYRIEYTDSFSGVYNWFVRKRGEDSIRQVRDINVYEVLEDYYQKQVLKQKEDYPYKKQTPEEVDAGLRNAMKQAKKDGVFDKPSMINCFIEGNPPNGYSYWNEWFRELGSKGILHNLKISSKDFKEKVEEPTKPMDEVVERLVKKYQAQKLYNRLFEFGYDKEDCDWILGIVEDWILDEQSSAGSQNLNNKLLVEGFNDAIRKMKEMLR